MAKQPKEIRTEVLINSNPAKIWNILMDFDKYPKWNPFIISIKGQPTKGFKITAKLKPPDAKGMTINPTILETDNERKFRWLGHLIVPGLFDGEHIFELIDNKNGTTTFIQREIFKGLLIPLLNKLLDDNTRRGFEQMNQQLKIEAEK
jgi:hypothetical protein